MLNIVVPMAGRGSRFQAVGYNVPKPLIPVYGAPMVGLVVENIRPSRPHRFIFLCLQEHLDNGEVARTLETLAPGCVIVPVTAVTEGAACTVLLAREYIDNGDEMMIANCDQYVDIDIDEYLAVQDRENADGLIMTFKADSTKWSYIRFGPGGEVKEVVEKVVVSDEATVGIYNFRRGSDFVAAADQMIAENLRVNGEFYVAPVYNKIIERGAKIALFNVGEEGAGMYGLGVPEDLDSFLQKDVSHKAADAVRRRTPSLFLGAPTSK